MNGFSARYLDSVYGGERSPYGEQRVADSTLLRPDRSRPYPSIGALPDQRTLHTGDGTQPAALQSSQPRALSVLSRVEVPVLRLIKPGQRRLVQTPPLCHACTACRRIGKDTWKRKGVREG